MKKPWRVREWALQILYQNEVTPEKVEESLKAFWEGHPTSEAERVCAEELVQGVTEHRREIDSFLEEYSQNWSLERMSWIDRNILRIGLFELFYRKETPGPIVINEAIELGKRYGSSESGAFINGILDRFFKERCGDVSH
ncbi:MAG: transcription antitermination factor NusB [Deltaproteobacteria bacterium]|nr:transcription antitermination factor NusB [Deltaproteobacteria bacterium]